MNPNELNKSNEPNLEWRISNGSITASQATSTTAPTIAPNNEGCGYAKALPHHH
jgi:hypothetical protein